MAMSSISCPPRDREEEREISMEELTSGETRMEEMKERKVIEEEEEEEEEGEKKERKGKGGRRRINDMGQGRIIGGK